MSRLRSAALGSVPTQAISTAPRQTQSVAAAAVATGPTTTPVAWVTGSGTTGPYLLSRTNNTAAMFGIAGTDLGIMWDNGIADNPATPVNEHQVLMAFGGDTFSGTGQTGIWRSNTLLRSSDQVLADGISVAPGQAGNVFSGSPLSSPPNFSKQIINSPGYIGPLGVRGHHHSDLRSLGALQQHLRFASVRQLHVGEVLGHPPRAVDDELLGHCLLRRQRSDVDCRTVVDPLGCVVPHDDRVRLG